MKVIRTSLALFLLCLWVCSCAKLKHEDVVDEEKGPVVSSVAQVEDKEKRLTPIEYVGWFRSLENGLRKSKKVGEMTYSLQFKSHEYIAIIETRNQNVVENKIERRARDLEGLVYFDLTISLKEGSGELLKHDLGSEEDYQDRVKYMSFSMQHDIKLVQGHDTIPCGLFHFERIYDAGPYSSYVLAFDSKRVDQTRELTFVLDDKVFHNGTIKFTYSPNKLMYVPKLRFS
jgi:hypothetical protein